MQIEVNTNVSIRDYENLDQIRDTIESTLFRFEGEVTRVAANVSDVNGPKGGIDRKCSLEGRIAGLKPVAASARAKNTIQAVQRAARKMKRVLNDISSRRNSHHT